MRAPTPEECSRNERLDASTYACWYPQMGGYHSKAVIVIQSDCFDVYVWGNGEFPFADGEEPTHLHHCSADQFIEFGNMVKELQDAEAKAESPGAGPKTQ